MAQRTLSREEAKEVKGKVRPDKPLYLNTIMDKKVPISNEFEVHAILMTKADKTAITEALKEEIKKDAECENKTKIYKEFLTSTIESYLMQRIEYKKDLDKIHKGLDAIGIERPTIAGTKTTGLTDSTESVLIVDDMSVRRDDIERRYEEARHLQEYTQDTNTYEWMRDNKQFNDETKGYWDKKRADRATTWQAIINSY